MVFLRKFISFLAVFITFFKQANVEAYFYKIDIAQSENNTVYLLSDAHNGPQPLAHAKHQTEIFDILQQKSGSLIVEDSSIFIHYTKSNEDITNKYEILSKEMIENWKKSFQIRSPLFFLHSMATQAGIASINVDFRFPQKRSLKNLFVLKTSKLNRLENELADSELYNAFVILRDRITELEKSCSPIIDRLQSSSKTIQEFVETEEYDLADAMIQVLGSEVEPDDTKKDILNCILHYIFVLTVDAETIGALHKLRNEKNIFVCLGSKHIENISHALQNSPFRAVTQQTGTVVTYADKKMEILDLTSAFKTIDQNIQNADTYTTVIIPAMLRNFIYAAIRVISQLFVG